MLYIYISARLKHNQSESSGAYITTKLCQIARQIRRLQGPWETLGENANLADNRGHKGWPNHRARLINSSFMTQDLLLEDGSFMRSTARHRTVGYKVCLLSASLLHRPSTANMGSDGFEATESLGGQPYFILLGMHGR
jgi:hypothetical protein